MWKVLDNYAMHNKNTKERERILHFTSMFRKKWDFLYPTFFFRRLRSSTIKPDPKNTVRPSLLLPLGVGGMTVAFKRLGGHC